MPDAAPVIRTILPSNPCDIVICYLAGGPFTIENINDTPDVRWCCSSRFSKGA